MIVVYCQVVASLNCRNVTECIFSTENSLNKRVYNTNMNINTNAELRNPKEKLFIKWKLI